MKSFQYSCTSIAYIVHCVGGAHGILLFLVCSTAKTRIVMLSYNVPVWDSIPPLATESMLPPFNNLHRRCWILWSKLASV